jgi:hypothetical protein
VILCRNRLVRHLALEATKQFDVPNIVLWVRLAIGTLFWSLKNKGDFFEFRVSHKQLEGGTSDGTLTDTLVAIDV